MMSATVVIPMYANRSRSSAVVGDVRHSDSLLQSPAESQRPFRQLIDGELVDVSPIKPVMPLS